LQLKIQKNKQQIMILKSRLSQESLINAAVSCNVYRWMVELTSPTSQRLHGSRTGHDLQMHMDSIDGGSKKGPEIDYDRKIPMIPCHLDRGVNFKLGK